MESIDGCLAHVVAGGATEEPAAGGDKMQAAMDSPNPALRRSIALLLLGLAVLTAFLGYAAPPAEAQPESDLSLVKVGVYENPPKIFTSQSGEVSGVFADVIEHRGDKGWKLSYGMALRGRVATPGSGDRSVTDVPIHGPSQMVRLRRRRPVVCRRCNTLKHDTFPCRSEWRRPPF